MVYMGSKRKYCKYIVPIIQKYIDDNDIEVFIDCFTGGGNLIDKIQCNTKIGNDLSPTLIDLHQQAQYNFSVIPENGNREWWDKAYSQYKELKKIMNNEKRDNSILLDMELWEIGAIEWYSSFSNGGFSRGYAKSTEKRNYYNEAYRSHKKQAENPLYQDISFVCGDYQDIIIKTLPFLSEKKCLFYCDIPYKATKPYDIAKKFDYERFYNWVKKTSKKYPIFISEQWLPEEFDKYLIWQKDNVVRTTNKTNDFKACEKLWLVGGEIK